jgi:hypothetical protein
MDEPTRGGPAIAGVDDVAGGVPSVRARAIAGVLRRSLPVGGRWLDVDGWSMGATIRGGESVLVVPATRPRRGQIWAFCLPDGSVFVHRFRRVIDGRYCFQGDARRWADEPVPPELLVGRVRAVRSGAHERRIGLVSWLGGRARLDGGTMVTRLRTVIRRHR